MSSQTITQPTTPSLRFVDHDWLLEFIRDFQERTGVFTIARLQYMKTGRVTYKNGRLDNVSESDSEGIGIQLFSAEGESVLGSSNQVTPEEIAALTGQCLTVLRSSGGYVEGKNIEIWRAPKLVEQTIVDTPMSLDRLGLGALREQLLEHHNSMRSLENGDIPDELSVTTTAVSINEEWRILRGDGGDVHWNVPRFALIDGFTVRRDGKACSTRTNVHERDMRPLFDDEARTVYQKNALRFRQLALDLQGAEPIPGGNYKIVIDAILAKGLAHEAFGHAAESDAVRFHSILGEGEKYRTGLKICKDTISIVDSSVEGDWAYAPYSSNGLRRQAVEIVKDGILAKSLADVYSANEIGVEVTGASRLESYGHTPIPRMSNIRLEIADALPWDDPTDMDPEKLHKFLLDQGLMKDEDEVLFLTGYRGGQVNPKMGDYVFNCQAIYRFHKGQTSLHQPALFSGKILETLESITAGIGPMLIHHMGTCGKAGQGVPSSGGGPVFTVIEKHPAIHIGGK